MSRAAIILRNVASNWVGFAVNAVVTLALTPFILRHLGTGGYGIWILSSSVIGYYGLLDLGFRAGVTQYLTRYLASGDVQRASECMSAAVVALAALGAVMVALSVGAAYLVPHLFQLPAQFAADAFWCILIVGISSGVQFALSPFTSVFTATQRFDLANLIGVATRLLTAMATVAVLSLGHGLIGLSLAVCCVSLIDYLIRWVVARRLAPDLVVTPRHIRLQRIKEISSFGAWNFLISINSYVYQHVPNMLVGAFMPIAAVGHYALATGLSRQVVSVLSPIGQVIYPAAAAADVRGDRRGLERLYHDGSRLMMLVMISIVLMAMFWAKDFYRLWIGGAYLSGIPFHSVALLLQVLLVSCITTFSNIGAQILMGAGYVRVVAIALVCGSAINLSLSVALIGQFGLLGVAMATVAASVAIDLLAMPLLLQRILRLSVIDYLRRACARPLLVGVLQAALIMGLHAVADVKSWWSLIVQGILCGGGCALLVVFVGITADERERFIVRPLRRLLSRVGRSGKIVSSSGKL